MKKILLASLLCVVTIIGVTGCSKDEQKLNKKEEVLDEKLFQCLENELGGYLVSEIDDLVEIPLNEIKNKDEEKIAYYKGVYASQHEDNMYVIVYPKNGTYESDVMRDFDNYFNNRFLTYQKLENSAIPTIYVHSKDNNINIDDLTSKCLTKNDDNDSKSLDSKIINKLNLTNRIVIKSGEKVLGEVKESNNLTKILGAISSSKQYGTVCLSDGYGFDFEMYDNDKLIDTIHVWKDGKRLIPASITGCYYTISNEVDLRNIIEAETDYIFYSILDYSDSCDTALELIYEENNQKYYLNCIKSDKMMIKFMIENKVMTLKSALENNYISAEKVANEYPDILIKKND